MCIASGRLDNFLQLLASLGIFIFVLAITYFVTRWIGNYQKVQMKNRNMQVVETLRITNNKYILIVKVSEEYLVLGAAKDQIQLLTKLNEESIENLSLPDNSQGETFQEILQKFKLNKK